MFPHFLLLLPHTPQSCCSIHPRQRGEARARYLTPPHRDPCRCLPPLSDTVHTHPSAPPPSIESTHHHLPSTPTSSPSLRLHTETDFGVSHPSDPTASSAASVSHPQPKPHNPPSRVPTEAAQASDGGQQQPPLLSTLPAVLSGPVWGR